MAGHLRASGRLVLIAWAIFGAGLAAVAQRDNAAAPLPRAAGQPATGTIAGRVLTIDGAPLRSAEVRVRSANGAPFRAATTDANGSFEIRDVRYGSWSVTASKPGFITMSAGQRDPRQPETLVPVNSSTRGTLTFALPRGGVITGSVLDEYGDPVAGVIVTALRLRISEGRRAWISASIPDRTDDTGAFRLHSLPAGDYYVSARRGLSGDGVTGAASLPTYFPGTGSIADAQRLALRAGDEKPGVVFPLRPTRAVRVSGVVVDSKGTPREGAEVELLDASDLAVVARPFGNFGQTQPDGRFGMLNVPPGEYILAGKVSRGTNEEPEAAFLPVTVGTGEVAGVTVATRAGATITGVVTAESGETLPASLRATVRAQQVRGLTPRRSATSERGTGAFTIEGLFGPLALSVAGLPEGWTTSRIEVNGVDAADSPIDFPTGVRLAARIVVTGRTGTVTGAITSLARMSDATRVIIFPEDPARWAAPARLVRMVEPDRLGRFRAGGLVPGTRYAAIALDFLEGEEYSDPAFLERLHPRATPFTVAEGATRALELIQECRCEF